jgi:predicted Zn-dependent peptidase
VFGDTGFLSLNADLGRDDVDQAQQAIRDLIARLQKDGLDPATFARLQQSTVDKEAWAVQGNSALADYYWGALSDFDDGRFTDPAKLIKAVSLDTANRALHQLLAQPGYVRVETPLLSYDELYAWVAGVLLVLALVIWRVRHRHRV